MVNEVHLLLAADPPSLRTQIPRVGVFQRDVASGLTVASLVTLQIISAACTLSMPSVKVHSCHVYQTMSGDQEI